MPHIYATKHTKRKAPFAVMPYGKQAKGAFIPKASMLVFIST